MKDICKEKVKRFVNNKKSPDLVKFLKEIYGVDTLENVQNCFVDDTLDGGKRMESICKEKVKKFIREI